jgi:hypothetical protein
MLIRDTFDIVTSCMWTSDLQVLHFYVNITQSLMVAAAGK